MTDEIRPDEGEGDVFPIVMRLMYLQQVLASIGETAQGTCPDPECSANYATKDDRLQTILDEVNNAFEEMTGEPFTTERARL
jgi:hypothetical protein